MSETQMRKLATIQLVSDIKPIKNADFLELLFSRGWQSVVRKNEFYIGQKIIWIEIDSVLPNIPQFAFMAKDKFKVGTKKLRRTISQGLCMSFEAFNLNAEKFNVGDDVTDLLGIKKYESPPDVQLKGDVVNFPTFIRKTDIERLQSNLGLLQETRDTPLAITAKADGCHHYNAPLKLWDGGYIPIGKVVREKLTPILIGMDKNGELVPSKVLDHFNNGRKKEWIDFYISRKQKTKKYCKKIRVTPNHRIWTQSGWKEACNITTEDRLFFKREFLDTKALKIIQDGLLGDGSLINHNNSNFYYAEGHKKDHLQYVKYIHSLLPNIVRPKIEKRISGFGTKMRVLNTKYLYDLTLLEQKWYKNRIKHVPEDLSWIDDISIARWYMDDGSLRHNYNQFDRAHFATNAFSKKDCDRLAKKLEEMYGVSTTVFDSKGWTIRINAGEKCEIERFWMAIAPHIIPCMRYKLPIDYRDPKFIKQSPGNIYKALDECEIIKIEKILNKKTIGYDIHTETENYICQSVLVHNCSMTSYWHNGHFGVCSRNVELKPSEGNTFWQIARKYQLEDKLKGLNLAIQGELCGPKIQGNRMGLARHKLFVYDIFNITSQTYYNFQELKDLCERLDLPMVPIVRENWVPPENFELRQWLDLAKGKYENGGLREGIVITSIKEKYSPSMCSRTRFKVISTDYLLKYE